MDIVKFAPGMRFKTRQGLCQVITMANYAPTGEKIVVYQALYGSFEMFARPLSEMEEKSAPLASKRPSALAEATLQEEPVMQVAEGVQEEPEIFGEPAAQAETAVQEKPAVHNGPLVQVEAAISPGVSRAAVSRVQAFRESFGLSREPEEIFEETPEEASAPEEAPKLLMEFLEADSYTEKLDFLEDNKRHLTDKLLDSMALALDLAQNEGSFEQKFQELRRCLRTLEKYECARFR